MEFNWLNKVNAVMVTWNVCQTITQVCMCKLVIIIVWRQLQFRQRCFILKNYLLHMPQAICCSKTLTNLLIHCYPLTHNEDFTIYKHTIITKQDDKDRRKERIKQLLTKIPFRLNIIAKKPKKWLPANN